MRTLADYTKWMREQVALKLKTIDGYDWSDMDQTDVAWYEGQELAYRDVLSLLDSIVYPKRRKA